MDYSKKDHSEKYGNSVEEAVDLALKDLKCDRDSVDITVLEEPSKGFLGLGSKLAKVRVELKDKGDEAADIPAAGKPAEEGTAAAVHSGEDKATAGNAGRTAGFDSSETKDNNKSADNNDGGRNSGEASKREPRRERRLPKSIVDSRPDDLVPVEDHKALTFLKDTTVKMGLDLSFKGSQNDENLYIDIEGKDAGTIIGKRGQTLDAIQYLTSLVVNKDSKQYIRVVLDAENYRAKREKTLEQLADRLAGKVIKTRRPVRLEPMNPYERMVIHATLQDDDRVVTRSEGDEPYRRVIIELK